MQCKLINSQDFFVKDSLLAKEAKAAYWNDLTLLEGFASPQLFEVTCQNIKKTIRTYNRSLDSQTRVLFETLKRSKEILRATPEKSPPSKDQAYAHKRHQAQIHQVNLKLMFVNAKLDSLYRNVVSPQNKLLRLVFFFRSAWRKVQKSYFELVRDHYRLQYQALEEQIVSYKKYRVNYQEYLARLTQYKDLPRKRREMQKQLRIKLIGTINNIIENCYKEIEKEEKPASLDLAAAKSTEEFKLLASFNEANFWTEVQPDRPYKWEYSADKPYIYIQFSNKLLKKLKTKYDEITQSKLLHSAQKGFTSNKGENGVTRLGANKANYKFEIKIFPREDRILGWESQFSGRQLIIFDWIGNIHSRTSVKNLN